MQDRVKTALDETRTLILGAQILLGFQFQAVFQDRFGSLPPRAHAMAAVALVLMLLTIGLLITPSSYHRVALYGHDSRHLHRLVTQLTASALLPFTIAFGLDVAIAADHMLGGNGRAGAVVGASVAALAAAAWYGTSMMMKRHIGITERQPAYPWRTRPIPPLATPPLHARIEAMLTEARVILPGTQAPAGLSTRHRPQRRVRHTARRLAPDPWRGPAVRGTGRHPAGHAGGAASHRLGG